MAILLCWALTGSIAMAANRLSPGLASAAADINSGADSLVTVVIFLEQDSPAYAAKGRMHQPFGAKVAQPDVTRALTTVNGDLVADGLVVYQR